MDFNLAKNKSGALNGLVHNLLWSNCRLEHM